MVVESKSLSLQTHREGEILDITSKVQAIVEKAVVRDGVAFLFVPGSTGALTTIEYEPGLVVDFPASLDRLIPRGIPYEHEKHWHDGNGHSHVRASMIGPDLFVPFEKGKLMLGTWQQIVFVELDVRPRDRKVLVQLMGE
jgi:secondary thiamine-phosphate synthase enzyme